MIKIPKLTNDTVKTTDEVIQETFTLMQSAFTKKEYDDDPFKTFEHSEIEGILQEIAQRLDFKDQSHLKIVESMFGTFVNTFKERGPNNDVKSAIRRVWTHAQLGSYHRL